MYLSFIYIFIYIELKAFFFFCSGPTEPRHTVTFNLKQAVQKIAAN